MIQSCVTFLPVSDIQKTEEFYTKVVGLTLWDDQGKCKIFNCGQGYWGFCQYDDGRPLATGVCLSLNMEDTADVDEKFRNVKAAGAEILQKPEHHKNFPVYSCFVKDPDGYLLEFQKILYEGK